MTDKAQLDVGAWRFGQQGWLFAVIGPDGANLYMTQPTGYGLRELVNGDWVEVKGHRKTKLFEGCPHPNAVEKRVREMFGPEGGES